MGAKYNWYIGNYWIEFDPWTYVRLTQKQSKGWTLIFEYWV